MTPSAKMMVVQRLKDLKETLEAAKKALAEYENTPSKRKGVNKDTFHCKLCRLGCILMILDMPAVMKTGKTMVGTSRMNMDVDVIMDTAVSMNLNNYRGGHLQGVAFHERL